MSTQELLFPLEPHQERVVAEHKDLLERLTKLNSFIESQHFFCVDERERSLLREQREAMTGYASVLKARMALWGQP